jgi:hypothetical protein
MESCFIRAQISHCLWCRCHMVFWNRGRFSLWYFDPGFNFPYDILTLPWYFDPAAHGISTPYLWYIKPSLMVLWTPLLVEMRGGSIYHEGFKIQWQKIDPGVPLSSGDIDFSQFLSRSLCFQVWDELFIISRVVKTIPIYITFYLSFDIFKEKEKLLLYVPVSYFNLPWGV